jgi:hypothetical protein
MRFRTKAVAAGFFAFGLLRVALAADPPNPIGFPKKAGPGGVGVYRVWYEDGMWHLRTSTENSEGKKDTLLVFTGSVRCDAKLTVEAKKLEKGNGKTSDRLVPHQDGKGFDFRFATYGATDQADFKIDARGKTLKFALQLDGEKVATTRIFIGAEGRHPEKSEFTLPAKPKK